MKLSDNPKVYAAIAAVVCSVAAFAADGLEPRIARVMALKGDSIASINALLRSKADPEGKDPLAPDSDGCTAFIVGRKASATGHVIVGHNNDGFGPMKYAILSATDSAPALKEPGRASGLGGGKSPVLYWHAVYSDKARSGKATGDVLLNEHGVMMFSNSGGFMREWDGRKAELPDEAEAGTVDGGIGLALRFEVAHRARSAAEGVKIATSFIDRYGYGPDARTFTIADRDEAWILCAVKGRRYVARRCPDDAVSVHPEEVPGVAWPVCRLRTLESVICRFADSPADAAIYLAPGRPCETKYDEFRPFRDAPPSYFATGAAAEALLSFRFVQPSARQGNVDLRPHGTGKSLQ